MRMEKEEALKLRKIASTIAKEIKHFWDSIQKVCGITGYKPDCVFHALRSMELTTGC